MTSHFVCVTSELMPRRFAGPIKCVGYSTGPDGAVTELQAEFDADYQGKKPPKVQNLACGTQQAAWLCHPAEPMHASRKVLTVASRGPLLHTHREGSSLVAPNGYQGETLGGPPFTAALPIQV